MFSGYLLYHWVSLATFLYWKTILHSDNLPLLFLRWAAFWVEGHVHNKCISKTVVFLLMPTSCYCHLGEQEANQDHAYLRALFFFLTCNWILSFYQKEFFHKQNLKNMPTTQNLQLPLYHSIDSSAEEPPILIVIS